MSRNRFLLAAMVAGILQLGTVSMLHAAPLSNDSVLSQNVKEADGTSGQNTNSGSGIKTGHLQDAAITGTKIADNAVSTTKLVNGAVTDAKITGPISGSKIADNTVTSSKIAPGAIGASALSDGAVTGNKLAVGAVGATNMAPDAIGTAALADSAVTDAKIAGPISASKISSTGLNADTVDGKHAAEFAAALHTHSLGDVLGLTEALGGKADVDHNHDNVYMKKPAKVVVVAQNGGDFTDLESALNSIVDASAINPYLIKIMPGIFDVGLTRLYMREFVDIEGSGRNMTIIQGLGNTSGTERGLISGINNSELRNLTVRCSGNEWAIAVMYIPLWEGERFIIRNAKLIAEQSIGNNGLISYAPNWRSNEVILENVEIISGIGGGSGYGIALGAGMRGMLRNVTVSASTYGIGGSGPGLQGSSAPSYDMNGVSINMTGGEAVVYASGKLTNVTIETPGFAISEPGELTISNSKINAGTSYAIWNHFNGILKIASSQINGTILGSETLSQFKLINCFDDAFDPIPNQ